MHFVRNLLLILIVSVPVIAVAELRGGDLPVARWYAHIDLVEMRTSDAGKQLYSWLEDEIFDQLREKIGFDADREANLITALATPEGETLIVVDGDFSQKTQDGLVAIGATASKFNMLEHDGKAYYQIDDENAGHDRDVTFENGAFMSVAIKDKLIVTSSEAQMQEIFGNNGKIPGNYDDDGALMVLRGVKSFMQAGMQMDDIGDEIGWDSNMLRNTEQVALLVSDQEGLLSVEAQLQASEEQMAQSLASIVRGLISLQAFSDDVDPQLSEFLSSTSVTVNGATLKVQVAVDPELLVNAIVD